MFTACILMWISIPAVYTAEAQAELHPREKQRVESLIWTSNVKNTSAVPLEKLRREQDPDARFVDYTDLQPSNQQAKRRPTFKTGKLKKMFGWGDFHCKIQSASLDLVIKGKIVDHGNGTFSIHFLCSSTGVGNVTIELAPSSKTVGFEAMPDGVRDSVESKLFNCRVESQKVEESKRGVRCTYDPSKSCEHQQTHSHVSWVCSKPFKVICVYVSFQSVDYKLLQKVCPDYNHHSDAPYVSSG